VVTVRRGTKPKVPGERQINVDLPGEVIDGLGLFCEASGLARKRVIELAVRRLLAENGVVVSEGAV
jgi:hypothetical protein